MSEKIVVECTCGKRYKATADKIGKKMKCKACGEPFEIQPVEDDEAPAAASREKADEQEDTAAPDEYAPDLPAFKPAKRLKLAVDTPKVHPDTLMAEIARPAMGRSLGLSVVIHAVLLGITSVGFMIGYASDASKYGTWHLPTIREKKARETKEAEQAAKEAEAEKLRKQREAEAAEKQAALQQRASGAAENSENATAARQQTAREAMSDEVITEQPAGSDVSFEGDFSLDEDEGAGALGTEP